MWDLGWKTNRGALMEQVDCVVAGAGVVGLAVARALALQGREVLVLERESSFGTGTSSRSSEVIHAGIYYRTGSLKAQLCVRGRKLLYEYCTLHGVPHQRVSKLIVATSSDQSDILKDTLQHARANGVDDLVWLSGHDSRQLEPALECAAALHSPSTGIVDSHALMLSLLGELEKNGGYLVKHTALEHVESRDSALILEASDGTKVRARALVNAAGLAAPSLARRCAAVDARFIPAPMYAKGNYFALKGRCPFSRLVYPLPEPGGLGVHLTLDLAGQARFGPDVQWVTDPDLLTVDPDAARGFYRQVRKYWPSLPDDALVPAYAGVRPKVAFNGVISSDFEIHGPRKHGVAGLVNLFGIESPGLTSALAIGDFVASFCGI